MARGYSVCPRRCKGKQRHREGPDRGLEPRPGSSSRATRHGVSRGLTPQYIVVEERPHRGGGGDGGTGTTARRAERNDRRSSRRGWHPSPGAALLHHPWDRSFRPGAVGEAQRRDQRREGRGGVRATRRRVPDHLVAARHQRRRLEVLPRPARQLRARAQRQAADLARGEDDPGLGRDAGLLRVDDRRGGLRRRADASAGRAEGLLQQSGVVQRRHRAAAAVLRLLHPLRRRHDGVDPRLVPQRGHHLPRRFRLGSTCRASAPRRRSWPAAAPLRVRCRS